MPEYSLRCDVRRTESTTDLLGRLHRSEPGFAPYLLTAWSPELTAQETVVLPHLALLLDEPVALRKPRTGHTASRRLTWHCAIRNTTGVELDDDDWFELTREVLDATGIEAGSRPGGLPVGGHAQPGQRARHRRDRHPPGRPLGPLAQRRLLRPRRLRELHLRPRPRRPGVSGGVYQ